MAPWSDKAKSGESGLADEYILTIREAKYGFPFENAPTTCALVLSGERNIDGNLDDGHLWLNTGAFEPGDSEGSFALHETQEAGRHFNKNSKLGKFLKSALDVGVPLEDRQSADRAQYEEKDAKIWEGLILRIEEIETAGKLQRGPDAGKEFTSRQPYVREYLGTANAPQASTAQAGSAPAANNGTVTEDEAKEIAKSSDSWIKFLETLTGKGVDPGDRLVSQAFYNEARA